MLLTTHLDEYNVLLLKIGLEKTLDKEIPNEEKNTSDVRFDKLPYVTHVSQC